MADNKFTKQICRLDAASLRDYFLKLYNEKGILNDVLDAIQAMIIATDKSHHITYYNSYAKKILQVKKASIRWHGKPILSILKDGQIKEKIRSYIEEHQKLENAEVSINGYHSIKMGNLTAFSMAKKGNIIGFTYVLFDNTVWTTRYLKHNQIRSISSLKMLTAGIAHEVKNPLGAIDLHFQLIERFIKKNFSSATHYRQKEKELAVLTNVVKEEIHRLNNIIEDFLLSVTPVVQSKREIDSINDTVQYVIDLLTPILAEKNIHLKVNLSTNMPVFPFDKKKFVQMLINIIKNSIEAIAETNRVGRLWITTLLADDKIVLEIIDNGCGIKKKDIDTMFEPFYSSKQSGTGLGLSVVSQVVHEHNGDIVVNSDANEGMEIRLEFPLTSSKIKLLAKP